MRAQIKANPKQSLTSVSDKRIVTENDVGGRAADARPDSGDDSSGHENKEVWRKVEHGPADGLDDTTEDEAELDAELVRDEAAREDTDHHCDGHDAHCKDGRGSFFIFWGI